MADNQPERFSRGSVTVSVFRHTNSTTGREFLTLVPSRAYKKDDKWEYTDSFPLSHVANLKAALAEAEQYMAEQERAVAPETEHEQVAA